MVEGPTPHAVGVGVQKSARSREAKVAHRFGHWHKKKESLFLMNVVALVFLVVASVALFVVPRRWAPVPLLVGACYMTLGQGFEISGLNFPIIRLLLLAGLVRVFVRGERPYGLMVGMDWAFVAWAGWAILASPFHEKPMATLVNHMGMVYNGLGIYFLMRCFCQTEKDARDVLRAIALLLVPVALEMVYEQISHHNLFSIFGGIPEEPAVRNGRLRSQGPFAHSILAGTVGAVCIPLMISIWRYNAFQAGVGLGACLAIILTSASSGPLMSVIMGLFALMLWRWRHLTRQMRIAAVGGYILLDLVMKAPAYYLLARIDLTGSSSSYHRAALIEAALAHLAEWWWAGTDYTRHWIPSGVPWSPDHVDITNHYLAQGVRGGLLLMLLFISLLWIGFRYVGQLLRFLSCEPVRRQFLVWSLGASLFAHAASCLAVAYFDQSILFLYLPLALITNIYAENRKVVMAAQRSG
jgi:hypothetical protein